MHDKLALSVIFEVAVSFPYGEAPALADADQESTTGELLQAGAGT